MSDTKAYDTPLSVEVVDEEVVLRSPDGPVGVSLTAAAATETARRLIEAADLATRQASQVSSVRD
ncbi:MAG TPA: hypothetical protein VFE18_18865 [Phenylobacterium sp.]|jgi:hypothetical protein|uniref:hypothetical protein n=1 Tax=Phenylobacterium sp. TaxID=1871053 RepID=UPI002D354BDC|nr:hypothetical protein [Phenylobacterium sp.]HZZ70238.1 hypothetical protein [Phenylobacterium sp.]